MKWPAWPRSLLGQMILSVAVVLLAAQTLSAVLLYRAAEQRRETGAAHALAFKLSTDTRSEHGQAEHGQDSRRSDRDGLKRRWQNLPVEQSADLPMRRGEAADEEREQLLRSILVEQGVSPSDLVVFTRNTRADEFVMKRLRSQHQGRSLPDWANGKIIVAGLKRPGDMEWSVARVPLPGPEVGTLGGLISQTLILYFALVGGLALLLRRITRPLAALTNRLEYFAHTPEAHGQLEPDGPEDTRRLIAAHNAMEARIAALLDEKDVMLGAIGHDLKTPLAALRVRIESVEDDTERSRMARTIEDITRTLDDILSLARVGRPSDDPEATDLAALTASIVEEFEDMGEAVTLDEISRIVGSVRATWLRRGLRNLVSNALRYGGGQARVSLLREDGAAVFRVEDDGPGIPEHELGAMLEPFRRGEASRNRETGGAGLGLTLARAIADQHGGELHLANRLGADGAVKGLSAEIRLPL